MFCFLVTSPKGDVLEGNGAATTEERGFIGVAGASCGAKATAGGGPGVFFLLMLTMAGSTNGSGAGPVLGGACGAWLWWYWGYGGFVCSCGGWCCGVC